MSTPTPWTPLPRAAPRAGAGAGAGAGRCAVGGAAASAGGAAARRAATGSGASATTPPATGTLKVRIFSVQGYLQFFFINFNATTLKSIRKGKNNCVLENSAQMLQDRDQTSQNWWKNGLEK